MNEFHSFGKILVIAGVSMVVIGMLCTFWDKIPFLGKLPGDIVFKGKNFTFYFPVATSIVLSLIISLILYLLRK